MPTECETCGGQFQTFIGKTAPSDRYFRIETRGESTGDELPDSIVRYFCSERCVSSFYGGESDE